MTRTRKTGLLALALIVAASAVLAFGLNSGKRHITVYFARSTGLYVGDDVRILGVHVGRVDAIHPQGTDVRVELSVSGSQKVPANAQAVIVAPSLVASRYVQLAPTYTGGPVLADHGVIPLVRTAVPVEWDAIEKQLTTLADTLGPSGANKHGALNDAIGVVADNLGHGTAQELNATITGLSKAVDALSSGRGDLFATISNLQSFATNLNANDAAVQAFSAQLSGVAALLADNKTQLATMLDTLDQALGQLSSFLATNRSTVKASLAKLTTLSQTLADERTAIADILHVGPTAISNVYNILDPRFGAFTGRLSADNFQGVAQLLCGAVFSLSPTTAAATTTCRQAVQPLIDLLGLSSGIPGSPGVPLTASTSPKQRAKPSNPLAGVTGTVTGGLQSVLGLLLPGGTS